MERATRWLCVLAGGVLLFGANRASAQDWPQWRGPNRDAKAAGFKAPQTWPKELTQKWKTTVGEGVATPALVGDRLYVFTRQGGNEVVRALDAASGKEIWKYEYKAPQPQRPGAGFQNEFIGPRSSPTVADGKVLTIGVVGRLTCLDAASGKELWHKDEFRSYPNFYAASSPIVVDGLCVAQLGGGDGAIVAFDLATGEEKWKWADDGTDYGSPVLMTLDGTKAIVTPTAESMVALNAADGSLLWKIRYRQGRYNAATPIVDEQTLIYAGPGRGATGVRLERQNGKLAANELWRNEKSSVIYNTPVLKDGHLYGIATSGDLFCVSTETGETTWSTPFPAGEAAPKGGGGRRGGGQGGFGSVVDAGPVLFALNPQGRLIVFEPNPREFKQITAYKVADGRTYAYPVISGNRIFVKDQDSVTLWTIE